MLLLLIVTFAAVSAIQAKRIGVERDHAAAGAAKASSINTILQETLSSAQALEGDLRTAMSASNMGSASLYAGRNDQAEIFYRAAMLVMLDHPGENHADTITAKENLANALVRLKRFDESAALMNDVLAARRAVLGDDNRLVARTMINMASDLVAAGRLTQAQAAFEEALPRFTRAYGPQHPDSVRNSPRQRHSWRVIETDSQKRMESAPCRHGKQAPVLAGAGASRGGTDRLISPPEVLTTVERMPCPAPRHAATRN